MLTCPFSCCYIGSAVITCTFICCSIVSAVIMSIHLLLYWDCRAHMRIHLLLCWECLILPSVCSLPVVYLFSHAQGEWQEGDGCVVTALCEVFGCQHGWRMRLCPSHRTTTRLTTTAYIDRSPSCRPKLRVESARTRGYTLNDTRLSRHHCSRTW